MKLAAWVVGLVANTNRGMVFTFAVSTGKLRDTVAGDVRRREAVEASLLIVDTFLAFFDIRYNIVIGWTMLTVAIWTFGFVLR